MTDSFVHVDDVWDAAADGVRAINARLSRHGLQLDPAAALALSHTIAGALSLAVVKGVE